MVQSSSLSLLPQCPMPDLTPIKYPGKKEGREGGREEGEREGE
jgi:hypothetical protein